MAGTFSHIWKLFWTMKEGVLNKHKLFSYEAFAKLEFGFFAAVFQAGKRRLCQPCMSNQKQFGSSHQTSLYRFHFCCLGKQYKLYNASLRDSMLLYVLWPDYKFGWKVE